MLDLDDLIAEMGALERQRQETAETLARIDGAVQLVRHLMTRCARADEAGAADVPADAACAAEVNGEAARPPASD